MAKVFALDREALNLPRAVAVVVILAVVVVVLEVIDEEAYVVTVVFAVLFVGLSDPGGDFGNGAVRMAVFAVIGALLTLLGFGIGGGGWGLIVLAAFAVTLVCGLAVKFGVHRFVAAILLNTCPGASCGSRSPAFCGWRGGANRGPRRSPRSSGTSPRGNWPGRSSCSR